jgi:hypothetical protein
MMEKFRIHRMKSRNQIQEMKLESRKGYGNGKGQAGVRYEPNQNHSRLRAVRRIANDRMDRTDGICQFSFGQDTWPERKEIIMKTMTAVRIAIALLVLGLACFLATPCHAQAEVAPDFYDVVSHAAIAQASPLAAVSQQQADLQFRGSFRLPYDVVCSGKLLPAGEYSVALDSGATPRLVTLRHDGKTITLRARVLSPYSAPGQSALLVSRSERGRTLEAIYVQKQNVILFFRADGLSYVVFNAVRADRVPIS